MPKHWSEVRSALDLAHKTGDTATIQFCLSRLMSDALVLGKLDEADGTQTLEYRFALESGDYGVEWLMLIASIHLGLGEAASAHTLLEQSMALARKIEYTLCAEANLWLGRAQQQLGNTEEAIEGVSGCFAAQQTRHALAPVYA